MANESRLPPKSTLTLPKPPPPSHRKPDRDKLLILALAVILIQNDAAPELIFALLYIAL